ncbi:MAG: cytochrome c [Kangiellaceae bacterium]|jgi:cytochrome c556
MKRISKLAISIGLSLTALSTMADSAKSQKHADNALKMRKAVFSLLGSNMGPMGAMAKGKIPLNKEVVEKNALRINQLSLMMADYLKTDTSKFKLKTDALDKIWSEQDKFADKIEALTKSSDALYLAAKAGDEKAIKMAIKNVGGSCGSCHDDYKAD